MPKQPKQSVDAKELLKKKAKANAAAKKTANFSEIKETQLPTKYTLVEKIKRWFSNPALTARLLLILFIAMVVLTAMHTVALKKINNEMEMDRKQSNRIELTTQRLSAANLNKTILIDNKSVKDYILLQIKTESGAVYTFQYSKTQLDSLKNLLYKQSNVGEPGAIAITAALATMNGIKFQIKDAGNLNESEK